MDQNTTVFKPQKDESRRVKEIMEQVVAALKDKGYVSVKLKYKIDSKEI